MPDRQSDAPFRPFETHLDEAVALRILRDATAGADDGELFLERRRSESVVLDDRRIKPQAMMPRKGLVCVRCAVKWQAMPMRLR